MSLVIPATWPINSQSNIWVYQLPYSQGASGFNWLNILGAHSKPVYSLIPGKGPVWPVICFSNLRCLLVLDVTYFSCLLNSGNCWLSLVSSCWSKNKKIQNDQSSLYRDGECFLLLYLFFLQISLQMQQLLEASLHPDSWSPVKIKFNWDASYWTKHISSLGKKIAITPRWL